MPMWWTKPNSYKNFYVAPITILGSTTSALRIA
jgi:hypothetical protein